MATWTRRFGEKITNQNIDKEQRFAIFFVNEQITLKDASLVLQQNFD